MQLGKTQVAFLHVAAPAINAVATFHASTLIAGAAFLGNEIHYINNNKCVFDCKIFSKISFEGKCLSECPDDFPYTSNNIVEVIHAKKENFMIFSIENVFINVILFLII